MYWTSCRCSDPVAGELPGSRGTPAARTGGTPSEANDEERPDLDGACPQCGLPVAARTPGDDERIPWDYTPRHLAEQILSTRTALEGQRKLVTILFVDVKGSMELADEIGAEALHSIMDGFFGILSEGVHRFQGTINQFTGDGVMALFGAPIAHEDHARRACYAALFLNERLKRYSAELKRESGIQFSVRMGMNSGEVVVGRIGDDLRMDYTAHGHTVGLAARMEQLADPGSIYVCEDMAALVEGYFQLEDLGPFQIKGLKDPVRVYDLKGIGPLRTRLDHSHARGLTAFIGRDNEMHVLETALERAIQGSGQVVGVIAEAGIGKSRLSLEFARRCQDRGIFVRQAHASAHGQLTPFLPVLMMLRSLFSIDSKEEPAQARRKIAAATKQLDESVLEGLPLIFEFMGVGNPDHPALAVDPGTRQQRLLGVITRLLHAKGRGEARVFLLEDLHWLDSSTELFLEKFVETLVGTQTLLLVNFRPDYHASWMTKACYQQLPLHPLEDGAVVEFLTQLLGEDPSVGGLPEAIHERCGGNPFFMEEVVQSLVDEGKLQESERGYRLLTPIEHLKVPDTVHAVLDARIDQLLESEKQILQTAAVIGHRFSEALLFRVLEGEGLDIAAALQNLMRLEFLYEAALYPETEYCFAHSLTREVAYRCQLQDQRARVHSRVARSVEALYPDKLDEYASLLAHHWEEAGDGMHAARRHRQAAEWLGLRDVDEAHRHWRLVLALTRDEPDSQEKNELDLTARIWLLQISWRLGFSKEEAREIYERGIELASIAGDRPSGVLLTLCYALHCAVTGDHERHLRCASEATRIAEELGIPGLFRASQLAKVNALAYQGRLEEALALTEQALAGPATKQPRAGIDDADTHLAYSLGMKAVLLSMTGRIRAAGLVLERADKIAERIEEAELRGYLHAFGVHFALNKGDRKLALTRGRKATELAEMTGIPLQIADAYLALGAAQVLDESWDEALTSFNRTRTVVEDHAALTVMRVRVLLGLSQVHLGLGAADEALQLVEEMLAIPAIRGMRVIDLTGRIQYARALLYTRGSEAAETIQAAIARSVELVGATGAEVYRPEVHRVLAEVAQLVGDEAIRKLQLDNAHRLYSGMDATGHALSLATAS